MRRLILIFGLLAFVPVWLHAADPLSTVRQVRDLGPDQASQGVLVQITGVVTYYEPAEDILFVQDRTGGIFVQTQRVFQVAAGDRVRVRGVTAGSYRTLIAHADIKRLGRSRMPRAVPASFAELISGKRDCAYVTVSGNIVSATMQRTNGLPFLFLELLMNGGTVYVHVEDASRINARSLLDARVEMTGVSGGRFDGKFHLRGANLYLSSPDQMRILSSAPQDLSSLPLTPVGSIMSSYDVIERSPRLRLRGTVTLYEPGSQLAIEEDGNAVLIHTHQRTPVQVGEIVYATGFADADTFSESLDHGQFLSTGKKAAVQPKPVSWRDALTGRYAFNLISLKGRLIEQVHEPNQDTLFIDSKGHVFSAVLRHSDDAKLRLPSLRQGSILRVSGVCFIEKAGPWNSPLGFELHLRDAADIHIVSLSSWWTFAHLVDIIEILGIFVLAALIWGTLLRRRMHEQKRLLRRGIEGEAIRQRRQMFLEKERSRVLEAINSRLPLDQVLAMITELITEQMEGLPCWCEVAATGAIAGLPPEAAAALAEENPARQFRRDILSSTGERLGTINLVWSDGKKPMSLRSELLDMGVNLAALAIDNRRLYENLVRRSEYDQLTEIPNRFHLESRLNQIMAAAERDHRRFAIIYVDLDRFKAINDRYGHHIGDMYLQNVAKRLSEKLRGQDTLARLGGDEFIILIPTVRDRAEAEDIASRMASCFDSPFRMDGTTIHGSASIGVAFYPEDGADAEQLMRFADSAMYASKHRLSWLGTAT